MYHRNSKPTALIAGISGILGHKIATAILDKGVMNKRGLVYSNNSSDKQQEIDELKAREVDFVEGDLFERLNLASLNRSPKGNNRIPSEI